MARCALRCGVCTARRSAYAPRQARSFAGCSPPRQAVGPEAGAVTHEPHGTWALGPNCCQLPRKAPAELRDALSVSTCTRGAGAEGRSGGGAGPAASRQEMLGRRSACSLEGPRPLACGPASRRPMCESSPARVCKHMRTSPRWCPKSILAVCGYFGRRPLRTCHARGRHACPRPWQPCHTCQRCLYSTDARNGRC